MVPFVVFYTIWLIVAVWLGAVIGSFLNVCIIRLPLQKSIVWPGSHCAKCYRPVRARDNIPILSWFILRGRCRNCGEQFSARYMLIEALTAALFGLLYSVLSPHDCASWLQFTYFALLWAGLIAATFIDFEYYEIPDSITAPMMILGLVAGAVWPHLQLQPIVRVLPALSRVPPSDRMLYFVANGGGWLLLAAWIAWLRSKRRLASLGSAEWIIMAVWVVFLLLHSVTLALASANGTIPPWIQGLADYRGLWTGVVGFLTGAATIWFVRLVAFAVLNCKRRSVAKIATRWRAAHPADWRRKQKRRRSGTTERPGYFYAWKLIFAGTGRMTEWKRLGPWIAREAMGFGDVTLMAAIGSFLGWQPTLLVFLLAPFLGLLLNLVQAVVRGTRQIPFGPYLGMAVVVVIVFWHRIGPAMAAWGGALIFLLQQLTEGAGE